MSLRSKIEKLIEKWLRKLVAAAKTSTASPASAGTVPDGAPLSVETAAGDASSAADAVDFSQLDFRWGGFNGRGAQLADGCRIAGLKVSGNGLSYKWQQGGCESLGAGSKGDCDSTIACLFCRIGGTWVGGKFDWISTSRTTRDFKNVRAGYHGWDPAAIEKADAYAFVIVARGAKTRSNVIAQGV